MAAKFLAPGLALLILVALPQSAAAAPPWLKPKTLSAPVNGRAPSVAVDGSGDAFAVWTRSGIVQAAQRPAGTTWSKAQDISGGCVDARGVELAVSPAGRAVVVWECPKGGNTIVQAATRGPGGSWSGPHALPRSEEHT